MIDESTKQQIFDTATIVDVVSDYVALRKQGANFVGLCPFHNDRRPSFHVSPSKNICKCFACGEGGTPVSFIMKIEKTSYHEALKILAKKYNIPIEEREETDEEKQSRNEAESMLLAQEFAKEYFQKSLKNTEEGLNIAIPYLQARGISGAMIERFALGYAPYKRNGLLSAAKVAGYNLKYFTETGLCFPPENGHEGADRFRERIIFPIHNISGKIVGFGGRILKKTDKMAKYINSPESPIYSKSRELYGLYSSKKAISQANKCFLVEGYMDVIAMHQAGVENVVASSGTALTTRQIMLIRRFTNNITVFYDGDSAGIKAALRGIDLLLEAGLQVRALPLPEGEDPDSFVRGNTIKQFEQYIAEHEVDFISFKTALYKSDMEKSPIEKANLVNDLLRSVASIPDPIQRSITTQHLAQDLGLKDELVAQEVKVLRNNGLSQRHRIEKRTYRDTEDIETTEEKRRKNATLLPSPSKNELALLRLIVRYGNDPLDLYCDDGTQEKVLLAPYVQELLMEDKISGFGALFEQILNECCQAMENHEDFSPAQYFSNHENEQIANLAINFLTDKYLLSNSSKLALRMDTIDLKPPMEELLRETEQLVNGMKGEYIQRQIEHCKKRLKEAQTNPELQEKISDMMKQLSQLNTIKAQIANILGGRTIIP